MEKKILSDSELNQVAGGVGGTVVAFGSFTSNTGTQLNLLVNWLVQSDSYGQKTLYVDVNATSYSLYSNGGGVELTVNGMVYTANASSVNYGGSARVTNRLASGLALQRQLQQRASRRHPRERRRQCLRPRASEGIRRCTV